MKYKKKNVCMVVLFTIGILLLVLAIVFNILLDIVIKMEIRKKLSLTKGTISYRLWLKPPVPVAFRLFVFDIQNPMEVAQGLEAPAVVEKGPYIYRMSIHKTNISRHDENNTISYVQPQSFVYDREASVGSVNDTFTTLNIPYITIASILSHWPWWVQEAMNVLMESKGEKPFKVLSVYDIFWGYKDPILEEGAKIAEKFHLHLPFLTGKFGFFADKNNTGDGYYNVFSGVNGDLHNYCEIDLWNGMRKQKIWSTEKANEIHGTDGSMNPPYVTPDTKLKIFDAYLHRVLHLKHVGTTTFKGLDTSRFVVPFSEFANATDNPDNAGYCTPNANYCIPSGCYNLSVASYGAPMYVSLPHFCGGDPYYQRQVKGLHPDAAKHQPFYDIHALTGVSIRAARKYQINVRTQSYPYFAPFKKFPVSYLPIMWIDGQAVINDKYLDEFKDEIQATMNAMPYVRGSLFGLSGLMFLVACCLLGYWYRKRNVKRTGEKARLIEKDHENGDIQTHTHNNGAIIS